MKLQRSAKMQFCDFANKAGRYSKKKQAQRGLSVIAELLVTSKKGCIMTNETCIKIFITP